MNIKLLPATRDVGRHDRRPLMPKKTLPNLQPPFLLTIEHFCGFLHPFSVFLISFAWPLTSRGWLAFQMGRQSRDTPRRSDGGVGQQAPFPAGRVRHLHGERGAAKASSQHRLGGGEAQLARRVADHARKVTLSHGWWKTPKPDNKENAS